MGILSFVLPAYKRKYLREAIASILGQTFRDFELIVVDDASPEHIEEVVASFSDPRLAYVRNAENLGGKNLVDNWNKALGLATGTYCVMASDDDIYAPAFAAEMLALAARHPQVDVLHCRTGFIDGDGRLYKIGEKRPEFEDFADLLYARGVKRCTQTAPEFMFRTQALKDLGGFVSFPLAWYSDDATWLALAEKGGIACSDQVLFHWRYSGLNISSRFDLTAQKVRAAEAYKAWLRPLIDRRLASARNDAERVLLEQCREQVPASVDQQTLYDLDDTRFLPWLRLLPGLDVPRGLKLRSIRNRVRKVFHT